MNARKSMSFIGAAIVIGVGVTGQHAFAGIDRGGKTDDPDRDKDKVSRGEVTGFGSVYVNGVRYATDSAAFLINGRLGSEADLAVGQIVTVYGSYDEATGEGTAFVVLSDNAIEGPVSMFDLSTGRMIVLGQTVHLNTDTAWSLSNSDGGIDGLGAGDVVSISGYRNADGEIAATLVSDRLSNGDFDVTGAISSVDSATTTFWIDGLSVDYGSANLFGLVGGMPTIGERVDVTGATLNASGQLIATSVAVDFDPIAAGAGTAAEIEGLVTARHSWNVFDLGGTTVRYQWNTRFIDGWLFGLRDNVKLEVEGSFDIDGVLVAETIRFEQSGDLQTSGHVEMIAADSFVIGGQQVFVTPETAYEDDSDDDDRRFHLSAMRTGDYVSVQGYRSGTDITATRVERDDFDWDSYRFSGDDDGWDEGDH